MGKNTEVIQVHQLFTTSSEILPFDEKISTIYGLTIKANVSFNDLESFVRIILTDKLGDEYLVYETYPLLEDGNSVSIDNLSEETGIMNGVKPQSLKVEVKNATLTVQSITCSSALDQSVDVQKAKKEKKELQNISKISRLNQHIKAKGLAWFAGETEVSAMSFAEKKKLFGQSTFPSGIEYYVGGVLSTSDGLTLKSATLTSMVDKWDWRNRHGKNWITNVKNQGSCGSCWAFAATGATEALVNLFYNQPLNMDLSEQNLLSCSGAGSCAGGYPHIALDYIKNTGIINETAFPYSATVEACTNKSSSPIDQIKIGGRIDFGSTTNPATEDNLKKMLIKYGPVSGGLLNWSHAMTLVGWQVVKEGDRFFYRGLDKLMYWYTVPAGSTLIGKTVWIFKNSWGTSFGDAGYVYVETDITNVAWTHAIVAPITSLKQNYTVQCVDNDHDGYYWWGLGAKPATCTGPDQEDGDDSNALLGPLDEFGNCIPLGISTVVAPVVNFSANTVSIQTGAQVQFSDMSTNTPTSWSWTISGPEQITSTLQNPLVKFNLAGVYTVTLTAANTSGTNSLTKSNYITVSAPLISVPVVDFTANKTSVQTGVQVGFSDLSTNSPSSWFWTVSGPVQISSTLQNPTLSFTTAGVYSVTLKAANAGGEATLTKTNFITVTVPAAVADFTSDKTTVTEGQMVNFSDLSTGNPVSWAWTIPGGTPSSSSLKNPSVTYKSAGKYDVTLVVTDANGNSTKVKTGYVTVNAVIPTYSTSHGNASKEWISQVSLNGKSFTSVSSGSVGYADLTANVFSVAANTNYTMSLTPKSSGKANYWYWCVWVDFNHDYDFDDAGEQILSVSRSKTTVSSGITIPAAALTGNTRMRISMKRDALPSPNEVFAYGEVKDFTLNISAPLAASNQLKSASVENPSITPALTLTVFPNPAERAINLKLDEIFGNETYTIYNMQGAAVGNENIGSTISQVDVSGLPAGIYIVKVKNGEQLLQQKFIKR